MFRLFCLLEKRENIQAFDRMAKGNGGSVRSIEHQSVLVDLVKMWAGAYLVNPPKGEHTHTRAMQIGDIKCRIFNHIRTYNSLIAMKNQAKHVHCRNLAN